MKLSEASERFLKVVEEQLVRVESIKAQGDFLDYDSLPQLSIGVCGGDGIGPIITAEAERVLRFLLKDEVDAGRIVFKEIDGLTIENRVRPEKPFRTMCWRS